MTSAPDRHSDDAADRDPEDTDLGETSSAGDGITDGEFAERVADQTSNDLRAEDVFEREADGASTDEPIAHVAGDDLA